MMKESTFLFIGGIVLGIAAGIFGTKKYYQNKYQKQYEDDHIALEEYYHRTDDYVRVNHDQSNKPDENVPEEKDSEPGGRMTPEERKTIKEKLDKNWKGTTNYAGMYRTKNNEDILEKEEGQDDNEEATDSPEEEVFEEYQKNKNKPPRIISNEAYSNLPANIDKEVLYFYAYDEVLCDEDEEAVEEGDLVGNALTKYGFKDNDERIIFVMNYSLNTCYEIQKVDASWTDLH